MYDAEVRLAIVASVLFLLGCGNVSLYAEWDYPKVPRRDPCTQQVSTAYVYVPLCRNTIPPNPRDDD